MDTSSLYTIYLNQRILLEFGVGIDQDSPDMHKKWHEKKQVELYWSDGKKSND